MTDSVVLLVEEAIGPGLPYPVWNQLISETRKLWRERIDREVVLLALKEWNRRPGLSPGILPHLVSDVIRSRNLSSEVKSSQCDWESKLAEEMGA